MCVHAYPAASGCVSGRTAHRRPNLIFILGLARAQPGQQLATAATVSRHPPRTHRLGTVPIGRSLAMGRTHLRELHHEAASPSTACASTKRAMETGSSWEILRQGRDPHGAQQRGAGRPSLEPRAQHPRRQLCRPGVFDEAVRIATSFTVSSLDSWDPYSAADHSRGPSGEQDSGRGTGGREILDLAGVMWRPMTQGSVGSPAYDRVRWACRSWS